MPRATKKTGIRVTTAQVRVQREKAKADPSPKWDGCDEWDLKRFSKHFKDAMDYYRLDVDTKSHKAAVVAWMQVNKYTKEQISQFKKTNDWRVSSTMGAIAACLNRGMPATRSGFNNDNNAAMWLGEQVSAVMQAGAKDAEAELAVETEKLTPTNVKSVHQRTVESTYPMTTEIEDAIEIYMTDPDKFDPKALSVTTALRKHGAKAAHAKIIKDYYSKELSELELLASGKADDDLKEAYKHRTKKQVRAYIDFLKGVVTACDQVSDEAKVLRKPRVKKEVPKEKLVEKVKYLKVHDPLNLVSINPVAIVGAVELWTFDVKTRKLSKYSAAEGKTLSVKNSTVINFDPEKSISKTLRKPAEQLATFKASGKVALRKFMDGITTTEIKASGRLSDTQILLKIAAS